MIYLPPPPASLKKRGKYRDFQLELKKKIVWVLKCIPDNFANNLKFPINQCHRYYRSVYSTDERLEYAPEHFLYPFSRQQPSAWPVFSPFHPSWRPYHHLEHVPACHNYCCHRYSSMSHCFRQTAANNCQPLVHNRLIIQNNNDTNHYYQGHKWEHRKCSTESSKFYLSQIPLSNTLAGGFIWFFRRFSE